ncbi:MAG: L,D-transpeptidase family protein [Sphingomonadales bacterium]|nr:L,D-transpeptidase family protein [Sphingomonadales bacterium]
MALSRNEIGGLIAAGLGALAIGGMLDLGDDSPHLARPPAPSAPQPAPAKPAAPIRAAAPAAAYRLVIRHILPIKGPIQYGEWHWDERGAPQGRPIITVDLEARVLSVFRGGYEIGTAAVLIGSPEKPTPTGVFPITQKDANHVSNLYDARMPYMLRLTSDGVTIHATKVENGYASHGCIGTPLPFAKKLFAITRVGDVVYITSGRHVGVGDALTRS